MARQADLVFGYPTAMFASASVRLHLTLGLLLAAWLGAPRSNAQRPQTSAAPPSESPALPVGLEKAWARRLSAVKSLSMTTAVAEVLVGQGANAVVELGALSDSQPPDDLATEVVTKYSYEEGKISLHRSSDAIPVPGQPGKTRPQLIRVTYDGTANALLVADAALPTGSIQQSQSADDKLYVHLDFLAVGLWLYPQEVLERIGWAVARMEVQQECVLVNGRNCRRISIPRTNDGRWKSFLDVDPQADWAPVQWKTLLDGRVSTELEVRYEADEEVGSVISSWSLIRHDDSGEIAKTLKGEVLAYEVNRDIADCEFRIDFPIGTHVVEEVEGGGRKYYRQNGDRLQEMDEREFGKTLEQDITGSAQNRTSRLTAVLITCIFLTVLGGLMVRKRLIK